MSMSYLDYLNNFNRWLETNALPGNAQLLYFRLLNLFNRAGWPEYVQVDDLRLMIMTGSNSRPTASRARDSLAAAGFITYEKGRKGHPGRYRLIDIPSNSNEHILSKNFTECVTESEQNVLQNPCGIRAENVTLIKNKIKTKTKTKSNSPSPHAQDSPPPAKASTPTAEETGFGPELQSAFEDWIRYKIERRESYKPTGLRNLVSQLRNKAAKYGESNVADLIRQCMSSNWKGIIYDKLDKEQGTPYRRSTEQRDWAELAAEMAAEMGDESS